MYIKIKRLVGILLAMAMVLTYIGAMPALATNGLVLQSGNQSNNNTGGVSPQTGEVIRIGSLILFNNMLMEHYQYSQANTKRYADAINQLYQVCEGIDTYVVIPPYASELYLSEKGSQHIASMNYLREVLDGSNLVDMTELFWTHKQEYIYFRTDHHWTARGAYYAYQSLMDAMGREYMALDTYQSGRKDGFYGFLYNSASTTSVNFSISPDYVEYFYPHHKATVKNYGSAKMDFGYDRQVLAPDFNENKNYYNIFWGGGFNLGYIHSEIGNDESIMVVIDSYGFPFLPFLIDQFEHIYTVDPRYFNKSGQDFALGNFMRTHEIQTLVFVNFPMYATSYYWGNASDDLQKMVDIDVNNSEPSIPQETYYQVIGGFTVRHLDSQIEDELLFSH